MGMPKPSLLDSTASVTTRQSESEAIASETASASLSLLDASAAAGPVKPAGPEDRVMVEQILVENAQTTPTVGANQSRAVSFCHSFHRQDCGGASRKSGRNGAERALCP